MYSAYAWTVVTFGELQIFLGKVLKDLDFWLGTPAVGQKSPTSFVQLHDQVFDIEGSWKAMYLMASHGIERLLGVPGSCCESFHFQSPPVSLGMF